MSRLKFFLKTSALVFIFLAGAKALNFFKKILIGKLFGVSSVADAFFAASYLPYYLCVFFDSIFFLVFLPMFHEIISKKGNESARNSLQAILIFVLGSSLLATVFFWGSSGWMMRQLVPGFKTGQLAMTADLFRIFSLAIVFMALRAVFQALNSFYNHYTAAASTGFVDSLTMLAITLAAWKTGGIYAAAWACVAGAVVSFLVQVLSLSRHPDIFPARLSFSLGPPARLFVLLLPMAVVWSLQQVPILILNRFGSAMWEGTISAVNISQTLSTVPMALLSQTVLFAVFPSMIKRTGEPGADVRETFLSTLRGAFLILIPLGFLISALASPIAAFFFEGGGISAEGTRRIANSLACFGWASFALYADLFMSQSLIGIRKPLPAIFLYTTRAGLTCALGYFFSMGWDYQGLALSFSMALVINLFVFFPIFFKASPLGG
ncbi:MAG TPA: lipid II flippase MurJ, partial [bacterium]|nr:lipid II flippase MurJ [bacterium]